MIEVFRNRELRILLMIMSLISLIAIGTVFILPEYALAIIISLAILLTGIALIFTLWRYRELEKLSAYLQKITNGDFTLDVRDNSEGELSILKNNIYKVTLMLSEQSTLLQKDKIHLTNAISDISHQLKTPLTSMMMMAELLDDPELPHLKRKEFTNNIQVQLERIEWLVSSLLKLSKIDAGTAVFKQDKIQVIVLIKKALDMVLIPMDIKGQSLKVDGDEAVSFTGDFNWTVEALINILRNCVEHTQRNGSIDISFAENVLFTEITIKDNGKGIRREDLPYLFNRFYKGKNASDESVGIGLAMAHSIITNQNGHIEVSSNLGEGTTFLIKFYKEIPK